MHGSENYYEDILYPLQNGVLSTLAACEVPFYLTGGTALLRRPRAYRVASPALSDVFVKRHARMGILLLLKQLFDPAYRVRVQKHVSTYGTDVRRDVVDDQQLASVPYRMRYALRFVRAGTSVNTALHRKCLLRVGAIHFGNFGS